LSFYDAPEAETRINSVEAQGGSDAIKVSLLPNLHFLCTFVRYRGVMNMSQKLLVQLLLGFVLSFLYLAAFLLTVHQQRTSYLSLTQAHSPQKFVNLSAEEINGRTLKAAAAIDRSRRRY
jgi:hypothetical protein